MKLGVEDCRVRNLSENRIGKGGFHYLQVCRIMKRSKCGEFFQIAGDFSVRSVN